MYSLPALICVGVGIYFATEKKFAAMILWILMGLVPVLNILMALCGIIYLIIMALKGKQ